MSVWVPKVRSQEFQQRRPLCCLQVGQNNPPVGPHSCHSVSADGHCHLKLKSQRNFQFWSLFEALRGPISTETGRRAMREVDLFWLFHWILMTKTTICVEWNHWQTLSFEIEVSTEFSILVPFWGSERANLLQNGRSCHERSRLVLTVSLNSIDHNNH